MEGIAGLLSPRISTLLPEYKHPHVLALQHKDGRSISCYNRGGFSETALSGLKQPLADQDLT